MNHVYRIVWSKARGRWVVAHELARTSGRASTTVAGGAGADLASCGGAVRGLVSFAHDAIFKSLALALAMAFGTPLLAQAQLAPNALPSGAQVAAVLMHLSN